jgi:hypothetical protein
MRVLLVCGGVLHHGSAFGVLGVEVLLAAGGQGGYHLRAHLFLSSSSFSFSLFTELDSSTEALKTLGTPAIILIFSFVSL